MQIHNFFSKKKLQYDRVLRATILLCVWYFYYFLFLFFISEKKELREALEHETNDLRSVNLSRLHPGQGFHAESRNRVAK
jgi:hypothetical protein